MPSVSNLFKRFGLTWMPDVDGLNAPEEALLRADNLIPDQQGALTLRRGSTSVYTDLSSPTASVHSLHTAELADGVTYRVQGADDKIVINNAPQGIFDGTGDIAIADDSYQIFMARGTTKKKFDGSHWNNWGLQAFVGKPTLAAVASVTTTVAAFGSSESPACTIPEGSGTIGGATGQGGDANGATALQVSSSSYRGVIQRIFSADTNLFTISGVTGTSTDLFDMLLKMNNPRNIQTIKIIFGLDNSASDPFVADRFEFEFNLQNPTQIPIKDFESEAYDAYAATVTNSLGSVRPQDLTGLTSPEQIKAILAAVGNKTGPTSAPPTDPAVWGHLTVTRGQFTRVGSTSGRGWDTVRGFKIILTNVRGATDITTFDTAQIVGGGDQTLTGNYRCVIRAVRNFGQYYEFSPPSEPSAAIQLNHQTLQITIPGTVLSTIDPQADQIWVYLFGGWLPSYTRFAVVSSTIRSGMVIDEFAAPNGSDMASADERARITSWGFTLQAGTISSDLVLTLLTGEMTALAENEVLEPYMIVPPDDIVAVCGPWKKRMFVLTSEGYVYPSTTRDPGSFNSSQVLDLTRYGNPRWMVKTNQGVIVGMEKDIVLLAGSGDDSADLAQIDLFAAPYNVGNPPCDSCRWVDGNSIVYRSVDGLMLLTGGDLQPVPMNGTSLLWRGYDRHGVPGLNLTTGRYRCAIDNAMLYVLAPEGVGVTSTNVIYRYATQTQKWSRLVYPQVTAWKSIFKEPDGTLVAGSSTGGFWVLDEGVVDNGELIPVTYRTPFIDGGNPLVRKSPLDLQLHGLTGTSSGVVALYVDGDVAEAVTYDYNIPLIGQVFREQAPEIGEFIRAQVGVTGNFDAFSLHNLNLTYRTHPQHTLYIDTGYFEPDKPMALTWLYEIHVDVLSAVDTLTVEVWINDVLKHSADITVTAGVRGNYPVPLPRGMKGYLPRIIVKTTTTSGVGDVGFECYGIDVKMASTGQQDGGVYRTVYPTGEAP